ncbi:MAG TPA: hydroxymethylglutaryl-CoA lyase [Dehalococcoidia bacterium]|nr:hydroxymethylglutaryl-CoA lyase [Dehalococcoidia bacterium]
MSGVPRKVRIVEVGPRDGLQNEAVMVPAADKVRFINMLSAAGFPEVEATSFVSPKAIPRLADAGEVFPAIERRDGTRYPVLVPNVRGLERAVEAGVTEIAVFTAASNTFNQHNINATIDESLENIAAVMARAKPLGLRVRGYVSTCFGCPFEGEVPAAAVLDVSVRLHDLGVDELSIGDTIGVGTPNQVEEVVGLLLQRIPAGRIGLHLHDTRGTALANTVVALQMGITCFDSAAGGLGGCPYAPGASGNLATEDLLYLLHGMGIETGVDLEKVAEASRFIQGVLGHALTSRYLAAGRPSFGSSPGPQF